MLPAPPFGRRHQLIGMDQRCDKLIWGVAMKTGLVLFLALVAAPIASGEDHSAKPPAFDFRRARWGMSLAEVKASEPAKPSLEDANSLMYDTTVEGYDVAVGYFFASYQLVSAGCVYKVEHRNKTDFIDDFKKVEVSLAEKYGSPEFNETVWKNDRYRNQPHNWGKAIAAGQLVYQAQWKTPATEILESLSGDYFDIEFGVKYNSRLLAEVVSPPSRHKHKGDN